MSTETDIVGGWFWWSCKGKPSCPCITPFLSITSQLLDDMNPPTKIVRKFLTTWGDQEQTRSQYAIAGQQSASKDSQHDAAGVALTLSRRLVGILKVKKILNIEAGLEIMALGATISSEVCKTHRWMISYIHSTLEFGCIPWISQRSRRCSTEVRNYLIIYWLIVDFYWRIWSNRLDQAQLEEISLQIQSLHSSMKNMMEYAFAISPLLALLTTGWWRRISGAHLLKVSYRFIPLMISYGSHFRTAFHRPG